ncbi:S-adenosylmethionine decarboxylase/ornithine decarboxylase [Plasmodium yoelii]|uniref:S-adenosylmethionine decarboxylase/ornithine decarboxylase n=3 Tax=Plasmodium yoelii TaxID=5861 RepID=A0AAF0AYV9_PLAYO|nr:S-adenosylmethionine decarboxylase/ornithine decarboxylase [Plasmodium yoelii]EAA16656.1 S-adenosylmethionine decarboxylase-ornithine decarboxylase-related [Plasmodium yoelii yoelii]WBY55707.1 S-adenosylmethionine decarboxylase/ornithine decarboxylase [Plasmodium yoelii yoelii]CDU16769.1 S-adenosylmethionine decarboxylase, putative [Plasmodium yoelii]VTZ74364.1 S-adenosylmethionine decarboxylase/ornithine decarboxylase [Plasmodium yoelii]|eukprot:XP_725091.1 S-adenosylmethionine decarboxylase/ornithine decarboxylase [Plasmodium yoelii]
MSNVFEGIEKRVVIKLRKNLFMNGNINSLLDISRDLWEEKLNLIGCNIVSEIKEDINAPLNERSRVYLLSESSLYIYNDMIYIKTCGKTKVLFFIPFLVDILIYKWKKYFVLEKSNLYNESFIQNDTKLEEILDFIQKYFEYSFFTHMNYKNVTKDGYYEQEYPHKSVEDEKVFFKFFLKSMEFVNTPLPMNRNHYIFFSQVNKDATIDTSALNVFPNFCSEMHLFGVKKYSMPNQFHSEYLTYDSLNVLSNHSLNIPKSEESEKIEVCSSSVYSFDSVENSSKYTNNTANTNVTVNVSKDIDNNSINTLYNTVDDQTVILTCSDDKNNNLNESDSKLLLAGENSKNMDKDNTQVFNDDNNNNYIFISNPKVQETYSNTNSVRSNEKSTCSSSSTYTSLLQNDLKEFHPKNNAMDTIEDDGRLLVEEEDISYISNEETIDAKVEQIDNLSNKSILDNNLDKNYDQNEPSLSSFTVACSDLINKNANDEKSEDNTSKNIRIKKIEENLYECINTQNNDKFIYNEFYFVPCGFSCNVANKNNYLCVHYSPEDCVSYVSVELSCVLKSENFMNFIKKQLNFYKAQYLYIINYLYDFNENTLAQKSGDNNKDSNNRFLSVLLSSQNNKNIKSINEVVEVNKKLDNNIIINNGQYYSLCAKKEQSVGFLKIQYCVYEQKNFIRNEEKIKSYNSICFEQSNKNAQNVNTLKSTTLSLQDVNSMYEYSYNFCKENNIHIIDIEDDLNSIDNSSNSNHNNYPISNSSDNVDDIHMKKDSNILKESYETEKRTDPISSFLLDEQKAQNEKSRSSSETNSNITDDDNNEFVLEKKYKKEMMNYYRNNRVEISTFNKMLNENIDTSVFCINLQKILLQYIRFKRNLPRVTPFYAVKSNDDEVVLKFLYGLNCSFDCASIGEINKLITLLPDISTDRIIYANTIKSPASLKYAKEKNINLCTFDNIDELKKICKYHPTCSLLLRINIDFKNYKSYMSSKYGANEFEWEKILKFGKENNMNIIGVSFHVGSNTKNIFDFCQAIKLSREVFDISHRLGFKFRILNMGGGYPEELEYDFAKKNEKKHYCTLNEEELKKYIMSFLNEKSVIKKNYNFYNFEKIALAINMSIDHYFKDMKDQLKIISEPGRYMVASSSTLAAKVIGKRCPTFSPIRLSNLKNAEDNNDDNEVKNEQVANNDNDQQNGDGNIQNKDQGNCTGTIPDVELRTEKESKHLPSEVCTNGEIQTSNVCNTNTDNENVSSFGTTTNGKTVIPGSAFNHEDNSKLGNITNIKKKVVNIHDNRYNYYSYYITDSIYGCFSGIIFDEYSRPPIYIINNNKMDSKKMILDSPLYLTNIFGQSCDGLDMITSSTYLPECNINDWIIYEYTGAYTFVSSSNFNGFQPCKKIYIFPRNKFPFSV